MSDAHSMVVQAALLGTDHRAGAPRVATDSDIDALVSRISGEDAAGNLLSEAALHGLRGLAGRTPSRAMSARGTSAPEESADQPVVHAGLASLLTSMLADVNAEVLPEWLSGVAARGWRAPWITLPALLHIGERRAPLRPLMAKVLGARGRWLASQNESWRYGIERPLNDDGSRAAWATGSIEERKAVLEQVRARDAALGRQLVESTWSEESSADRIVLITGLRTGLADDDEAFLERALDDRRQEVRGEAAALLVQLPGSAFTTRMIARARAVVSLNGRELLVEPSAECDSAMLRDGITAKSAFKGVGDRAWWLMQIIGAVPPRIWTEQWKKTPAAVIALAVRHEWSVALLSGWSMAARTHRDAEWADALLRSGVADKTQPQAPTQVDLLALLETQAREAFITEALRAMPAEPATLDVLVGLHYGWSTSLGRAVVHWLAARIAAFASDGSGNGWRLAQLLPGLALRMPPALASEVEAACRTDLELTGGLPRAIDRFNAILAFRHALHQEFDK